MVTFDDRPRPSRRRRYPRDLRDRVAKRLRRDQPNLRLVPVLLAYGPDVSRHRFIRPVQPWERLTGL